MKILSALTAGLIALTGVAAVPASAQERVVVRERTVGPGVTRVVVRDRTVVRHDNGRHNGWRNGWRNRARTRCTWQWRGHRHVRVCRTVRW